MSTDRPHRAPPEWLRALGGADLPPHVDVAGGRYGLERTFKHDFFAATGLYGGVAGRIVVKVYRTAPLLGLPMRWSGGLQADHECRMYRLFDGLPGIPRFIGRVGATGFAHEYIAGHPLTREERVNDDFFPRLAALLREVHHRGAAYVDLEKRENILVGDDGRPYLIDFQISWHVPLNRCGDGHAARAATRFLQAADRYHLLKHRRRLRPDQLTPAEWELANRLPFWIRWHRAVFRPVTEWRRRALTHLGARPLPRP